MKISLIGAGAMGTAFLKGVTTSGFLTASDISVYDIDSARVASLADEVGCVATESAHKAVEHSNYVVICVKPHVVQQILKDLAAEIGEDKVVIIIAAGVSLSSAQSALNPKTPVLRVMPNTPVMVAKGASAISAGPTTTDAQIEFTERMFESFGITVLIEEKLMDAVTGFSGSGPAFVYTFIESLIDAGVSCGLPRSIASKLAVQTVSGAAEMILQLGNHPAVLRDQVTTPGGTTIAGLMELERSGLRAAVANAVHAAVRRSAEMSK